MMNESAEPIRAPSPDVSVVVPTYRGSANLPLLTGELCALLDDRGTSFEILLVNDSSPDDTWDVVSELAHDDPRITGIDLLHNHGQPTATMCGLAAARGEVVATMDDDLEHSPKELLTLLDALEDHPDWDAVVATWPISRSPLRNLGSRMYAAADRLAWGTPSSFRHTAFRVMRRPVCDALVEHRTRSPVVGPMLHRVSPRVHNVEVQPGRRVHGTSGFTMRDGVSRALQNFRSGSTAPLHAMTWIGMAMAFVSFLVGGALLVRWLLGADSPSGWLSNLLATVFIGGTILLAVGILGGYLDLIVREVRQTPRWSIRSTTVGTRGDEER